MADMSKITTVCVYCGSGPGTNPRFVEAAIELGKALAENSIRLVYGGGSVGLMGAVAKSTLDHGGSVTGIIPEFLRARREALRSTGASREVGVLLTSLITRARKKLLVIVSKAYYHAPYVTGYINR